MYSTICFPLYFHDIFSFWQLNNFSISLLSRFFLVLSTITRKETKGIKAFYFYLLFINYYFGNFLSNIFWKVKKFQKLVSPSEARYLCAGLQFLDTTSDLLLPLFTVISNSTAFPANQVQFTTLNFKFFLQILNL